MSLISSELHWEHKKPTSELQRITGEIESQKDLEIFNSLNQRVGGGILLCEFFCAKCFKETKGFGIIFWDPIC